MSRRLTLLLVEGSQEDCVCYRRFLETDDRYTYRILEAETGEAALEQCRRAAPDLILLNYSLPDINGLEFINLLKQQPGCGEIPTIMLSACGDETIAVQSLKNGVQDYLVKSKLTANGLCEAVHHALEQLTLMQQLQQQLQQQRLLRTITLQIRQSLNLTEILQTAVTEVRQSLQSDRVLVYQFTTNMDGNVVAESVCSPWVSSLGLTIEDTCFKENLGGDYRRGKIWAASNIYSSGLNECHLQLLKRFQVQANLVVPIILDDKDATDANTTSPRQLWGLLIVHQCAEPRNWQTFEIDLLNQLALQLSIAIQQAELYHGLQTLNTELEAKVQQRTAELQESERRFRAIFNNTFQFTGLLSTEGVLLEINQSALDFSGLQREQVVNRPFRKMLWWGNSAIVQDQLQQAIEQAAEGMFVRYEAEIIGANGLATIDFSIRPLKDEQGQVVLLIPEGRDISSYKRVEAELRRSEVINQAILAAIPDLLIRMKRDGQYLSFFSGGEVRVIPASVLKSTVYDVLPPDLAKQRLEYANQALETGKLQTYEQQITVEGEVRYEEIRIVVSGEDEVLVIIRDITERRQVEAALRESEARFRVLADSAPVLIWLSDPTGACTYMNQSWTNFTGRGLQQELGMGWAEGVHPADVERCLDVCLSAFQTQQPFSVEYRLMRADGEYRWIVDNGIPRFDAAGKFLGFIGSCMDIHDRRQAEVALQQLNQQLEQRVSERTAELLQINQALQAEIDQRQQIEVELRQAQNFLQTVIDHLPVALYVKDGRPEQFGSLLLINQTCQRLFGLSAKEIVGRTSDYLFPQAQADLHEQNDRIAFAKGKPQEAIEETLFSRMLGQRTLRTTKVPLFDANHQPEYLLCISEDITERKQAEEALRESEARFRQFTENIEDVFWMIDLVDSERLQYVSSSYERIWGRSTKLLIENPEEWSQSVHPDDRDRVLCINTRQRQYRGEYDIEYRIVRPDQEIRWIHDRAFPILDESGNLYRLAGVAEDITARKQAEIEIIQNRDLREAIFNESTDAIFLVDTETRLTIDCNRRAIELFEVDSKDELIGIEGQTLQRYPFTADEIQTIIEALNTKGSWSQELEYVSRCGRIFWGNLSARTIQVANRSLNLVQVTDISDRKSAEEHIRASLKEKEVLLQEIHHRVKNNLYIISSLLKLQARPVQDAKALDIFRDSQNRIRSIALIHEKLYRSQDLANINFAEYVHSLTMDIARSYSTNSHSIRFHVHAIDALLNVDVAIPCGLIINELVSNAIKYAFPSQSNGNITVELRRGNGDIYELIVSDDGIGLPEGFNFRQSHSLGLRLVCNLTEQIGGQIELEHSHGTQFKIIFLPQVNSEV